MKLFTQDSCTNIIRMKKPSELMKFVYFGQLHKYNWDEKTIRTHEIVYLDSCTNIIGMENEQTIVEVIDSPRHDALHAAYTLKI